MQIHFGNYTWKADLGFAIFLLGLYVGVDLQTMYVCLSNLISAALNRAMRCGKAHSERKDYWLLSKLSCAHWLMAAAQSSSGLTTRTRRGMTVGVMSLVDHLRSSYESLCHRNRMSVTVARYRFERLPHVRPTNR